MILRTLRTCLVLATSTVLLGTAAEATTLPPGRSWAPTIPLTHPEIAVLSTTNLVRDQEGRPALVAGVLRTGEPFSTWAVLAWRDSAWVDSIWSQQEVGGMPPRIVQGPNGGISLLSTSRKTDPNGYVRLSLWSLGSQFSAPETVAVTTSQLGTFALSAAESPRRRWVARAEQPPNGSFQVHTYISDGLGQWQPVALLGSDEWNCAITALDDTTALLVYYGLGGSKWTRLQGTQWTPVQAFPHATQGPRFVPRPAGGRWLVSTDGNNVHVDAWNGSGWTSEAILEALRDPGHGFLYVNWLEPSLETDARPAIAWQEAWYVGLDWHTAAHVAWPTESGWTPGYQVPLSDTMGIGPTVTLDRDGDVWLVWSRDRSAVHMWTHSYVSATSSAPVLDPAGTGVQVQWFLSESAPGSWWAVLRDPGSGAFEEIARVQAKQDVDLSWVDENLPPPGSNPVRYRIRRESVDARYVWLSPVTVWGLVSVPAPGEGRMLRLLATPNPLRTRTTLELDVPEPGPIEIVVHDVGGRRISSMRVVASQAVQTVPLDLSGHAQGVYFVIARDAHGRSSPVLKLVRLE